MRRISLIAVAVFMLPALLNAAEVRLFAAASLSDALQEIAARYATQSHDQIIFNFAGSSTLARQIELGAPADLFLSADEETMNRLERQRLIDASSRSTLLSNTLVVIVPRDGGKPLASPRDLASPRFERIAIGEPSTVPAGIYAKAWLTRAGLWTSVLPKLVPAESVRGALAAVESGNVDAAIVYATDALIARRSRIAWPVPQGETPSIAYPVALVAGAANRGAAFQFLRYLRSKPALAVFARRGFLIH